MLTVCSCQGGAHIYFNTPLPLCCPRVQQLAAARWSACGTAEGTLHSQDLQGRGTAQDEHWTNGQCQKGLHRRVQRLGGPLCAGLLCWTQGTGLDEPTAMQVVKERTTIVVQSLIACVCMRYLFSLIRTTWLYIPVYDTVSKMSYRS